MNLRLSSCLTSPTLYPLLHNVAFLLEGRRLLYYNLWVPLLPMWTGLVEDVLT